MRLSYSIISLLLTARAAVAVPVETTEEEIREALGERAGRFGLDATFDYVIVGGGTAGLALANRLSADPKITVAVIERGGFYQITNPLLGRTPAGDVLFVGADPSDTNPLVDWNFVTEPQAGANGREIHYARGKCLGGSSARNFMIYQRGTKQSYQKWADAVGDPSYTWDALQPHFKKSVSFTPPSDTRFPNASAEFNVEAFSRTAGGPLQVSYSNYAQPFSTWMEPALNEIGVKPTEDFNSGTLMGAQYCSSSIRPESQTRDSSQTSFLREAMWRKNLKVYMLTLAKKIIFDNNKRATAVEVDSQPFGLFTYKIRARKEVILSAGAFQSPQLLMVSGIGPKAELAKHKIPVIVDRPGVGQGMQDHVFFGPTWRVNVETLTRLANDPLYVLSEFGKYSLKQEGVLANPVCDFLGWEKLPRNRISRAAARILDATFPPDWPEVEFLSAAGYVGDFSNLFTTQPKDGFMYATILGGLVAPLSRGTVTLRSADTADLPLIDPRWLTDPTDISVAIGLYKRLREAFDSDAMQPVLADKKEYFPGPAVQTDSQILNTIQNTVMTIWHASCTCRMGKTSDPMAVVDNKAKVIGVQGLRVVDASSFALLPPGHPQSTVYMLAEKIVADILAERSMS
ncbi:gmc oxidoreductase [Podospora australis]|uniref:Gmc oxidoreductase n=1 Tax=Podospora australis TaxID=1536484 RepID=A0AAN6WKB3_9PEZI|nr:gmc oxidoreductase [Podospora australis]